MNKQQKQEMGQGLVDFMLDDLSLDEIAETFEMKVDTKFYSYEEDKENLVKDWKIKFPKWDIWIRRAYKEIWSGDINYEEIRFSGDGEDFNEWLKIKWYEAYRDIDWDQKKYETQTHILTRTHFSVFVLMCGNFEFDYCKFNCNSTS